MINKKERTFKDLSAEEVLDAIDNDYYIDRISEINSQIMNIQNGRPAYFSGPVLFGAEKDRKIAELRQKKERYKKIAHELSRIESTLHTSMHNIKELAIESALQNSFEEALYRFVESENDSKKSSYQLLRSKIGRKLEKKGISLRKNARKINKKTYNLLKRKRKTNMLDITQLKVKGSFITSASIERFIEETNYQLNWLMLSYYDQEENKNKFSYDPRANNNAMHFMGVDIDLLIRASNQLNVTIEGIDANNKLKEMTYFKKYYQSLNIKYGDIEKLEKLYQEIHILSKEVAGLEVVLNAFKNTTFANSDIYIITVQIKNNQKNKLRNLYGEAESLYDTLRLAEKRHQKNGIDKFIQELQGVDKKIESYGPTTASNYNRLQELHRVRSQLVSEIEKYLATHPEINAEMYRLLLNPDSKLKKEQPDDSHISDLSIQNVSKRELYYQQYTAIKNSGNSEISFVDYLKSINNDENINDIIKIEGVKQEILELMYTEYQQKYLEYKCSFKFYCTNLSSMKDKFSGNNGFISNNDIDDFIRSKMNQSQIDFDGENKTI